MKFKYDGKYVTFLGVESVLVSRVRKVRFMLQSSTGDKEAEMRISLIAPRRLTCIVRGVSQVSDSDESHISVTSFEVHR